MPEHTINEDNESVIPSRGWYNLVVFDFNARQLERSLEGIESMRNKKALETVQETISFIEDRMKDGSYKESNTGYELDHPTLNGLIEKRSFLTELEEELKEDQKQI